MPHFIPTYLKTYGKHEWGVMPENLPDGLEAMISRVKSYQQKKGATFFELYSELCNILEELILSPELRFNGYPSEKS